MKRMRFYMMLAMVCCAVVSVRAQGHGWVQYSFSGAYENFAHTFENSGYTLTVEAEGHSKRRVYGAFLVGLSTYEGSKPITLESDLGPVSDNLADKKTQMLFALGPGFDLLSNQIDRFYLNLYGGYAVVDYEYDVCDDVLREINKSLKQEAYEKECRLVFGLGFDGLGRFAVVPIGGGCHRSGT